MLLECLVLKSGKFHLTLPVHDGFVAMPKGLIKEGQALIGVPNSLRGDDVITLLQVKFN